jgi:hypothetical protein
VRRLQRIPDDRKSVDWGSYLHHWDAV